MNRQDFAEELARDGLTIGPKPRDPRPVEEKYDMGPPTDREKAAKIAKLKARLKEIKRRDARIRRAITNALDWHEIAAFAGAGDPDHVEYKEYRAKLARSTLERVIQEELNHAYRKANR
jgi:hypothetical protein